MMIVVKELDGSQQNKNAVDAVVLRINKGHGKPSEDQVNDAFICNLLDADLNIVHRNAAFSSDSLPFEWTAEDQEDFDFVPEPEPEPEPEAEPEGGE